MVVMAVFGAPVGLKGEIRLKTYTGDPEAVADYGPLYTRDGRRFDLTVLRAAKEVVIVRVAGVTDRDAAARLTNIELLCARSALGEPKDEDEFFHADLIGLRAETREGTVLGTVAAILNFGAGDVLDIRPPRGKNIAFPFTRAVVPVVDVAGGRVIVDPPEEIDGDED